MPDYHAKALNEVLGRTRVNSLLAAVAERAVQRAAPLARQLQMTVLAEVPEFSRSRNPDLLPELARHGQEHVSEILRLLRGGRLRQLDFVHEHARRRAEQRFPMAATLHAYRSGHKVLSHWLRESVLSLPEAAADKQLALTAIVDFSMEYTDAVSTAFADTYASHALLLAEVAGDQRSQLLRTLLSGQDEADVGAARVLRAAGFLEERQTFCVALARSVDPAEMADAARARRLVEAVDRVLADSAVRRVIDLHDYKVAMVFADVRRISGWTAPRSSLARRISAALIQVGNAALIGVSNDVPSTAHIPAAYQEALTALELASVNQRVLQFTDIPLRELLLHFSAEQLGNALPPWSKEFYASDDRLQGALSATLRAYAAADMNILQAAKALEIHPNTIYGRMQRIADISGLQPRSFAALSELLIVCDGRRTSASQWLSAR
jgi:DNA-binding PucR family transcriptional regulator